MGPRARIDALRRTLGAPTLAEAEARVVKGEALIVARERSGRPVPDSWYDAYEEAWIAVIAAYEAQEAAATVARQAQLPISQGVR